jgi:type VI secretion system protein ImpJ
MKIHRPLFWHQGLFLQPQHLQLLDRSFQSLLAPLHAFLQPHFWGVGDMEIPRASLGTRTFTLQRGNLMFPDGTHVELGENGLLEARSFEEAWVTGGKPFLVYLGLKKWNDAGENVTVLEKLENISRVPTRFVTTVDPEEVKDLHAGGPQGRVKRLYYALKIHWETEREQLGDSVLIPLAQLERVGAEIKLSEQFIPPCLTIASSEPLRIIIKEIRDQITARSRRLEEYKRQRGIQTAEFGSRDVVYLLALRSLSRFVPMFVHFTETQVVHPWAVYGALRQLVGELSTFSEKVNALGEQADDNHSLQVYDHQNLWECFSTAQALVTRLLDEITAEPEYVIRLLYDGTYYGSDLKPAVFEGRNRFFLVLKTGEDPKSILRSVGTVAKFGSREQLPKLIARALPGVGLEHLPVPPQELPRRANSIYFAVDHHGDQWAAVAKGNNIALYWDSAPEDLEAELMIVGR